MKINEMKELNQRGIFWVYSKNFEKSELKTTKIPESEKRARNRGNFRKKGRNEIFFLNTEKLRIQILKGRKISDPLIFSFHF